MTTEPHPIPPWRIVWRLMPYARPYVFWLVLGIVVAMCEAGLNIATTYLAKHMVDTALASQADAFLYYIKIMTGVIGIGLLLTYLSRISVARISAYTIRDLQNHLTGHFLRLPISTADRYHSGDLVSRFNGDARRLDNMIGSIPHHVYQPVLFIGAFVYMFILSWKLLLAIFILIPISALVSNKLSKPVEGHARAQREYLAEGNAIAQDTIAGIAIVKAFQLQMVLVKKYVETMTNVQDKGIQIARIDAYLTFVWLILRFTPQLVLPVYGGYLIIQGELTVGGLLACARLMWYIFLPVESFLGFVRAMRETAPAAERLWEIADQHKEPETIREFELQAKEAPVRFEKVSFQYDDETPLFQKLTFTVPSSKTTALVGPSGCGKSTILKLLCGFYKPQRGDIAVYGNDMNQVSYTDVRTRLSLVSQDTYLFPATVAENIAYGRLGTSQEEVESAARAANAHDFIQELPKGYETSVGERGVRLSGGQRQRIAIARAILKDAPVLLLDEPTSALDAEAEAVVEEALRRLMQGRTVLIIAHRLSTIQHADRMLVLDQGKIVEEGTHESLMQRDGAYKKLYMKQTSDGDV